MLNKCGEVRRRRNPARAMVAMFLMAVWLTPATALADMAAADNMYAARKWSEAAEAYESLAQQRTGEDAARAWFRAGMSYRYWGRYDQAIEALQRAIDSGHLDEADVAKAVMEQGYCHYTQRQHEEAIEKFDRALGSEHAGPRTLYEGSMYYGFLLNRLERYDEAIERFYDASRTEGILPAYQVSSRITIGNAYLRQERYDEARAAYEDALSIEGDVGRMGVRARVKLDELDILLADDEPFFIFPYHSRLDGESVTLHWVSKGPIDEPTVTIADASDAAIELSSEDVADEGFMLHRAHVTGLSPGVRYAYHVTADGEQQSGSFRTAPGRDVQQFRFSALGDTQTNAPAHAGVAANLAPHEPEFVIHTGDLVNRGNRWLEWKSQLFDPGEPYLRDAAFFPARGNHDSGPYYPRLFGLTEAQHFSVDFGHLRLIVIDAFGPGRSGSGRERQVQWLEETLTDNDATWTIVAVHDPMVNSDAINRWFGEDDMLPLIQEHEVDLVLSGHHHLYRRFLPIHHPGRKPVLHITTGGAGGSLGGDYYSPMTHKAKAVHHHLDFVVDGDRLEMTAIDIDGDVLDTMTLIKRDGMYQSEVMAEAVPIEFAKATAGLGYEMLVPRSGNVTRARFDPTPAPGEAVTVTFDLVALPGGGMDPATLPDGLEMVVRATDGSDWQVQEQAQPMADGVLSYEVVAPVNLNVNDEGNWSPALELDITVRHDGRTYPSGTFVVRPAP